MTVKIFNCTSLLIGLLFLVEITNARPWAYASDSSEIDAKKFDRELYHTLKSQPEFHYVDAKTDPGWGKQAITWLTDKWSKAWGWLLKGRETSKIFMILLDLAKYLSVFLLLLVVIWIIARMDSFNSNANGKTINGLDDEEAGLIAEAHFPSLIESALEKRQFALAIRYKYLYALQSMEEKGIIVWESQKTDSDYLREISNPKVQSAFEEITNWYRFVWFGKRAIDGKLFQDVDKAFERFKMQL